MKILHVMDFTAFSEVQLNPGIRDIGASWWAKPIHRAAIAHPHPSLIKIYFLFFSSYSIQYLKLYF
jgi:hypothetical protein